VQDQQISKLSPGVEQYLALEANHQQFGIPVSTVHMIIRAVELQPVAKSPRSVKGVFRLYGELVILVDLRWKFGFRRKEVEPENYYIILNTDPIKMALVSEILPVVSQPDELVLHGRSSILDTEGIPSTAVCMDGNKVVMIYDICRLFIDDAEKTYRLVSSLNRQES